MRERLLLATGLAIPVVLVAVALWNLAGSTRPIQLQADAPDVQLALARPVSDVQVPPTLQPALSVVLTSSSTPTPAYPPSATPSPTTVVTADTGMAQAPSRATAATNADRGRVPATTWAKGKRRG